MDGEVCGICGGDGRIGSALGGSMTTFPGWPGNGRKMGTSSLFRDVTKTKPSHHRRASSGGAKAERVPTSFEGVQLAKAIRECGLAAEAKARLILEIIDSETTHGRRRTKTFLKKVRTQIGPAS